MFERDKKSYNIIILWMGHGWQLNSSSNTSTTIRFCKQEKEECLNKVGYSLLAYSHK